MAGLLTRASWSLRTWIEARGEARLPFRPLDGILERQRRRVRAIVRHAWESVPYYRDAMDAARLRPEDFRSADDLARLPLVSGEELAEQPDRFASRRYPPARTLTLRSSGTTGRPKTVRYSAGALFTALAHGQRQREVLARFVGRRFGYRELTALRSASVSSQLRAFYESHSWVPRRLELTRSNFPLDAGFEEAARRIDEFRPDVILGYGSWLGAFFRWSHERGRATHLPRVVWYGADRMAEADRALVERELGLPVVATYQCDEALRLGFQCERREGFHLFLDDVAVRVVRADGRDAGPGESGEIVISNLTNPATVLLNYRLGDLVTVGSAPCPCGRSLPTIERIEGRAGDLLLLPDGEARHPLAVLQELQEVAGIARLQILQENRRELTLRAVPAAGTDWPAARGRLEAILASLLGGELRVVVERVEELERDPSGKVRAVVSRLRGGA